MKEALFPAFSVARVSSPLVLHPTGSSCSNIPPFPLQPLIRNRSGLDILRHIQTGHPGVRVLVISGLPEQQYAVNVLRAGASGYLSKDSAPEELMKAVRTVLSGRRYVSAALAEILVADLDGDPDKPLHARLSTREFQIFCKLAAGRGVSDIANELSLSVKTVSTYRSRILEKMSFNANADITSYALRNGLIQ